MLKSRARTNAILSMLALAGQKTQQEKAQTWLISTENRRTVRIQFHHVVANQANYYKNNGTN